MLNYRNNGMEINNVNTIILKHSPQEWRQQFIEQLPKTRHFKNRERNRKGYKKIKNKIGVQMRNEYLFTLGVANDRMVITKDPVDLNYIMRKVQEKYTKADVEINLSKENTY